MDADKTKHKLDKFYFGLSKFALQDAYQYLQQLKLKIFKRKIFLYEVLA